MNKPSSLEATRQSLQEVSAAHVRRMIWAQLNYGHLPGYVRLRRFDVYAVATGDCFYNSPQLLLLSLWPLWNTNPSPVTGTGMLIEIGVQVE
jgi:hypothetical protein